MVGLDTAHMKIANTNPMVIGTTKHQQLFNSVMITQPITTLYSMQLVMSGLMIGMVSPTKSTILMKLFKHGL